MKQWATQSQVLFAASLLLLSAPGFRAQDAYLSRWQALHGRYNQQRRHLRKISAAKTSSTRAN